MSIDPNIVLVIVLIQVFFYVFGGFSLKTLSSTMGSDRYNNNLIIGLISLLFLGNFALLFVTVPALIISYLL